MSARIVRAKRAPRPARSARSARGGRTIGPGLRFTLGAVASLVLLAVTFWGFVLTEAGQRLENLALAGATLRDPIEVEGSLAGLSGISILSFAAAIAVVFLVGLVRRRPGLAVLAAGVMGTSILLAELLKAVLTRPHLVDGPRWLLVNTFPSGHATIAATIAIGALLVAPDRLRWLVLPLVAVYAAVIAQAVQVAGWHRLSGTLGGVLLSVAVACIALAVMAALHRVQPSPAGRIPRAVGIGLLAVSGLAVAAAVIVAALPILFPILDAPRGADSAFAHTALELVGVGVTVLLVTFFATLIDPYSLGAKARMAPTPAEVPAEGPAASPPAVQPSPAGTPED